MKILCVLSYIALSLMTSNALKAAVSFSNPLWGHGATTAPSVPARASIGTRTGVNLAGDIEDENSAEPRPSLAPGAAADASLAPVYDNSGRIQFRWAEDLLYGPRSPDVDKALSLYRYSAELGYYEAQYALGVMYEKGLGIPQSSEEAVKWYKLAADQKYAPAQNNLGVMYEKGLGIPQSSEEAVKWYKLAADQKYAPAQNNLGIMYEKGQGVSQNLAQAVEWITSAADQGYATAQYNLGIMYENGYGVDKDLEKAVSLYKLAAQEHAPAQNTLGVMYQNGLGVEKDLKKAVRLLRLAARQNYPLAQNNLGIMYALGLGVPQDVVKAAQWYKLAADIGFAPAQNNLGVMYEKGQGVSQNLAQAVKWYKLAAAQKFAPAQNNLGGSYEKGLGVPQSSEEAVKWYKLAADQEYAPAQYNLGRSYEKGRGMPQSLEEAVKWYKLAAAQKFAPAQNNLGVMYEKGQGVSQNLAQALEWITSAADLGYATAQYNLGIMYENGLGVEKDLEKAVSLYKLAAQEHAPAQNKLMYAHLYELGTSIDYEKARSWFNTLNTDFSLFYLGLMNHLGLGGDINIKEATRLYSSIKNPDNIEDAGIMLAYLKLHDQSSNKTKEELRKLHIDGVGKRFVAAIFIVGFMHEFGVGGKIDLKHAKSLYELAKRRGFRGAGMALERIESRNKKSPSASLKEADRTRADMRRAALDQGDRSLIFEKVPVQADGDCGFTVLGLNRRDAITLLLAAKQREDIRSLVAPEIKAAFLAGDLPIAMKAGEEYERLSQAYRKAHIALDGLVRTFNDALEFREEDRKNAEGLIIYLAEKGRVQDAIILFTWLKRLHAQERAIEDYSKKKEVYETFIKEYLGKGGWLAFNRGYGTSTLDALATLKGMRVYIWEKDRKNTKKYNLIHSSKGMEVGSETSLSIHLLYDGATHYDLLKEVQPQAAGSKSRRDESGSSTRGSGFSKEEKEDRACTSGVPLMKRDGRESKIILPVGYEECSPWDVTTKALLNVDLTLESIKSFARDHRRDIVVWTTLSEGEPLTMTNRYNYGGAGAGAPPTINIFSKGNNVYGLLQKKR